jgi:hypothetical protein
MIPATRDPVTRLLLVLFILSALGFAALEMEDTPAGARVERSFQRESGVGL